MPAPPRFSVVTITLNHLDGLHRTYDSIHAQTHQDYEWLVIDGLSDDGTHDFLKTTDAFVIRESDLGLYDAMNKGLKFAKGAYVIFMNAGDCFADKDVLQKLSNLIDNDDPDFIYGDALEIRASDKAHPFYKKARAPSTITHGMITHHQSMLYNKSTLGDLRYNLDYDVAADYDFTLKFMKQSKKISYLNAPICLFEGGGLSQKNVFQGRKQQFLIRQKSSMPLWRNMAVFGLQTLSYGLRLIAPFVYWRLKR